MSRHAAPDDEVPTPPPPPAPSTQLPPPTSDTGPLYLGHGDWPPLRPSQPSENVVADYGASEPRREVPPTHETRPVPLPNQSRFANAHIPAEPDPPDRRVEETVIDDVHGDELHGDELHGDELHGDELHAYELPGDELPVDDLGLLPAAPAAEAGHRAGRGTGTAVPSGRRPLGILVSLSVIAALVTGIFFGGKAIVELISPEPTPDYSGQGNGAVEVEIPDGASTGRIAEILADNDVVASSQAFLDAASGNADILTVQPGRYDMRLQMSGQAAVERILDPAARLFNRATIPEGYTVARTLESLAEQTDIPLADFEAAAAAPDQLGLPTWSNGQLEGFLYPDTYDIGSDATAVDVLQDMVAHFNEVAIETGLEAEAASVGLTPYEVLTVASMVQSEVTVEAERPLVARVIYNRLDQTIPLGIDATLAYERGVSGNELTSEELQADSPYNTRTRTGLPPTPISNPGQPAILGALNPAPGDYLYYVLQNNEGDHFFTASYEEFLAAKAQCEAAGLGCG